MIENVLEDPFELDPNPSLISDFNANNMNKIDSTINKRFSFRPLYNCKMYRTTTLKYVYNTAQIHTIKVNLTPDGWYLEQMITVESLRN